ncbi:MAG: tRNA dihydrouridine synthase DusB [Candidatus Omnitrophota bacterium]|nr:tRNA dihydrouridine synthase DusB [Candidatus Omnitrophota bacterium]
MRLKDFNMPSVVIQSPMANCTDLPFRLISRQRGMKFAFLEMVSAQALVHESRRTAELLKTVPEDKPVGAQLVGCEPDIMGEAAARIEAMGYDVLDLNLGCPVPKITGNGAGSALLREPDKVRRIFAAIIKRVRKIPVTVKMRLGYTDATGEEACAIARIAQDEGLSAVAVHGRTRAQGYSGTADYEAIRRVKQAVQIPVFGNGDVVDAASALKLRDIAGVDGIMIGRGALGNPWIYEEIEAALEGKPKPPKPDFAEKKRTLLEHMDLEICHHPRTALFQMRRISCWYFKEMPFVAQFREKINGAETLAAARDYIEAFSGGHDLG